MRDAIRFSLLALILSAVPRLVFACVGGDGLSDIDPTIGTLIVGSIVTVVGLFSMMYWRYYKKFLDEKWGIVQYLILIPILIPVAFFLSLLFFTVSNFLAGYFLAEDFSSPLLGVSMVAGLILGFLPLIFKRKWVYAWGVPTGSLLGLIFILWIFILSASTRLCGNNPSF